MDIQEATHLMYITYRPIASTNVHHVILNFLRLLEQEDEGLEPIRTNL